ncbi:MAG: 3-keto-5-aminohexanoate cleavage protein [Pseudomonadota bacterium]
MNTAVARPMRDPVVLMVAPNGARRVRGDHPRLPLTEQEIVDEVAQAHEAGAQAAHVHVRDDEGQHVLDAARYRSLTEALRPRCGDKLIVQITTEAAGRYSPTEQHAVVEAVEPSAVSIALGELFSDPAENKRNGDFLHWVRESGIAVQWILYAPEDVTRLGTLIQQGFVPRGSAMLFVLGRYSVDHNSRPDDLWPFLAARSAHSAIRTAPYSVCAFGRGETACLTAGLLHGGNARVGFENSLWHPDGSVAESNAERVAYLVTIIKQLGWTLATADEARENLGLRQAA